MARVTGPAPSNFQNTVEITVGATSGVKVGMPVLSNAGLIGKVTQVYSDTAEVRLITDPGYSVAAEVIAVTNAPAAAEGTETASTTPSGETVPDPNSTTTTTPPTSSTLVDLTPRGGATTTSTSTSTTVAGGSTSSTSTTAPIDAVRETGTLQGQGNGKPIVLRFVDDVGVSSSLEPGDTVQTAGGKNDLAPEGLPIGTISKISQQPGSRTLIVEVEPNASLDRLYFVSVVLYSPGESAGG
jgi:rod shape-determining protein MreC